MTEEELNAVADKLADKLQQPPVVAEPVAKHEIVTYGVVEGKLAVLVKAPSQKYYVGQVGNWIEVPAPGGNA